MGKDRLKVSLRIIESYSEIRALIHNRFEKILVLMIIIKSKKYDKNGSF